MFFNNSFRLNGPAGCGSGDGDAPNPNPMPTPDPTPGEGEAMPQEGAGEPGGNCTSA